jgi:hypothetical protein
MTKGADFNALEIRKARNDGAEIVKNSGRGQRKGDARLYNLLIDYKFTEASSFSVNLKSWEKHAQDAWGEGYEPVIVPVFESHRGKSLAIVDWEFLKGLVTDLQQYMEDEHGNS